MNSNIYKIINVCLELLIWVGLWGATENILNRFKFNKNKKLCVYIIIVFIAFSLINYVNKGLSFKYSIHD